MGCAVAGKLTARLNFYGNARTIVRLEDGNSR
jgi:hypothetical protein